MKFTRGYRYLNKLPQQWPQLVLLLLLGTLNCHSDAAMKNRVIDHQVQAAQLHQSFIDNQSYADSNYTDKILEVVGILKGVNFNQEQKLVLTLESYSEAGNIICEMQGSVQQLISRVHPGSAIRIKGICRGHQSDVVLQNCVLLPS